MIYYTFDRSVEAHNRCTLAWYAHWGCSHLCCNLRAVNWPGPSLLKWPLDVLRCESMPIWSSNHGQEAPFANCWPGVLLQILMIILLELWKSYNTQCYWRCLGHASIRITHNSLCSACVVCGGRQSTWMLLFFAYSKKAWVKWEVCPSTIRSLAWPLATWWVGGLKLHLIHSLPMTPVIYLFSDIWTLCQKSVSHCVTFDLQDSHCAKGVFPCGTTPQELSLENYCWREHLSTGWNDGNHGGCCPGLIP